jgi:hypothetical protein
VSELVGRRSCNDVFWREVGSRVFEARYELTAPSWCVSVYRSRVRRRPRRQSPRRRYLRGPGGLQGGYRDTRRAFGSIVPAQ